MRPFQHALIAATFASLSFSSPSLAAGGGKAKAGPQGIPFTCSDGRPLRVVYGREGPKAHAQLMWEGAEPRKLEPAHALEGLRYTAELQPGQLITWTTDGIEGRLLEESADGEREIARCKRSGWDGGEDVHVVNPDAHGDEH